MDVTAIAKDLGVPPRKVRLIVDAVRGKKVDEAMAILRFMASPWARSVAKVVKSAAANAENNYQMTPSDLRVVSIFANAGRTQKRHRAGARGRAKPILKRSSHITVVVAEEE